MGTSAKISSLHGTTKQSLKSYMDSIRKKDTSSDATTTSATTTATATTTSDTNLKKSFLWNYHNTYMIKLKTIMDGICIKWKDDSILLSHIILGDGKNLRHDII